MTKKATSLCNKLNETIFGGSVANLLYHNIDAIIQVE